MACSTQWRIVATMAGAFQSGLDYAGVQAYLQAVNLEHLFPDIMFLEQGAIAAKANRDLDEILDGMDE